MIDLRVEQVFPLSEAPNHLPRNHAGKPISFPTVFRWSLRGVRAPDGRIVKLETIRLGGRLLTSLEALQRFAERQSPPDEIDIAPTQTCKAGRKASEKAERELRKIGI